MADRKRIMVSLPVSMVRELDGIVAVEKLNRSQLIYQAMKFYLTEMKKRSLQEELKQGYLEMAELNLTLAEEDLHLVKEMPEVPVHFASRFPEGD